MDHGRFVPSSRIAIPSMTRSVRYSLTSATTWRTTPLGERDAIYAPLRTLLATNQSSNDADQDRVLLPMLTEKTLDEHNRQSHLYESSLEPRRQQFERFREAARVLGIDFSDQALAAMWQGLGGLTPTERFIIKKDN